MIDLIDRNEMLRTYQEVCMNIACSECSLYFGDTLTGDCLLEKWIHSLPSVEPTIIRCRDCKHHDGIRCFRWNSTIITGFDDFCSNAEKRGEEDE